MKKNIIKNNDPIVLIDEQHAIPKQSGNGILRYFLTSNGKGNVLRYSLAYINHKICSVDNGRVVGYDNDHNYHHRHCMGKTEPIEFNSHQDILERFEQEWRMFHENEQN